MGGLRPFMHYYEKVAAPFEKDFASIRQFLERCDPGPVIDVGAGIGRLMPLASPRNPLIFVERDPYALERLHSKALRHPHATVVEGDALNVPVPDGSASGVILALSTLGEIRPAAFALAEVVRLLRPGSGRVYFYVDNPHSNYIKFAAVGPRAVNVDGEVHAVHIDTYPTPNLGEHAFQTQWVVRNAMSEVTYAFNQVYPPLCFWQRLCDLLGLAIERLEGDFDGAAFDPDASIAMIVSALRQGDQPAAVGNDLVSKVYDAVADDFDGFNQRNSYQAPTWVAEQARRWTGRLPRVLDLGCGHGYVGRLLKDANAAGWVYGLDANARLLQKARATGAYRAVIQADFNEPIPVAEELCFDIVSLIGASEFVRELDGLVHKAFKMLSLGGELWLTCEETSADSLPSGAVDPTYGFSFYHHTLADIESACASIGFSEIIIKRGPGYTRAKSGRVVPYLYICAKRKRL